MLNNNICQMPYFSTESPKYFENKHIKSLYSVNTNIILNVISMSTENQLYKTRLRCQFSAEASYSDVSMATPLRS